MRRGHISALAAYGGLGLAGGRGRQAGAGHGPWGRELTPLRSIPRVGWRNALGDRNGPLAKPDTSLPGSSGIDLKDIGRLVCGPVGRAGGLLTWRGGFHQVDDTQVGIHPEDVQGNPTQPLIDRNFGFVFSFWDRLFGTYQSPETAKAAGMGLAGYEGEKWQSVVGMLATPLRITPPGRGVERGW